MSQSGLHLGMRPETLRVLLTTGADFTCTLELNAPWPAGTTLALALPATSWAATISGASATFNVDKAVTDTIADGTTIKLVYTNGATDQVWAVGTVVRTDG